MRQTKIGTVYPLTYSIRIPPNYDDIWLEWSKERPPTPEEQLADLKNPAYREIGYIPKRWDRKSITLTKSHLARVEKAFSKFVEWAEIAAKENIKDHEKVIDDINDEPNKTLGFRLTFVFVAPATLRIQCGPHDFDWENFTIDDVAHFQALLKQLPEMEEEANRKRAEAAEKKVKTEEERKRIENLLK